MGSYGDTKSEGYAEGETDSTISHFGAEIWKTITPERNT